MGVLFQVLEKPTSRNGGFLIPLGFTPPRNCGEYPKTTFHTCGIIETKPHNGGKNSMLQKGNLWFRSKFRPTPVGFSEKTYPAPAGLSEQLWIVPEKLSASEKREIHVQKYEAICISH